MCQSTRLVRKQGNLSKIHTKRNVILTKACHRAHDDNPSGYLAPGDHVHSPGEEALHGDRDNSLEHNVSVTQQLEGIDFTVIEGSVAKTRRSSVINQ